MKIFLKIIGTTIIIIILLLIILPFAFHGKIDDIIKKEGNKMLRGEFSYSRSDLSLFRHFPKASISIYDFWIKGENEFTADTLASIQETTIVVDLFSIFSNDGFDISKVEISNVRLNAIVLPDGRTNWDILKEDDKDQEKEEDAEKDKKEDTFRLKLKRLFIKELNLAYDDRELKQHLHIGNFNLLCSGDFSNTISLLNLQSKIDSVNFVSNGVTLLSNAEIYTDIYVNADFEHQKYVFKKNEFKLNAITTSVDGWLALVDDGIDMDLSLNTSEVGFKEILSLIPAIYSNSFESLRTDGTATLNASAKGILKGDSIVPTFSIALEINDGMFQYPSLPLGVNQINLDAKITNPGGSIDQTLITIHPFTFRLGENPFSLTAIIKDPTTDADFQTIAKGRIDLASISKVIPFGEMKMNGVIDADVSLSGKVSAIENEQYDRISASGNIGISNMQVKMKDGLDVDVHKSLFTFTPKYLQLSETTIKIGDSDLTIESKLENYMGYIFKETILKGSLNITSNYLNLDDFTTSSSSENGNTLIDEIEDKPAISPASSGILIIPKNIDFTMNASLAQVVMNQMSLTDVKGRFLLKEGVADMQNLSLYAMGGSLMVNGSYSSKNEKTPELTGTFKMNDIQFAEAYKDLHLVQQMAPIFESIKGSFSGNMKIETTLDENMSPVLSTFQGNGNLSTNNISLSGIKTIDQIADAINKPDLKELTAKNISLDFIIKDGRLQTQPFDLKVGDFAMSLSGTTGLDQTIDYAGVINTPIKVAGANLPANVKFTIGGTFASPKFALDTKSMANQAIESVGEKAKQQIGQALGLDSVSSSNIDSIKGKATEKALDFLKGILK